MRGSPPVIQKGEAAFFMPYVFVSVLDEKSCIKPDLPFKAHVTAQLPKSDFPPEPGPKSSSHETPHFVNTSQNQRPAWIPPRKTIRVAAKKKYRPASWTLEMKKACDRLMDSRSVSAVSGGGSEGVRRLFQLLPLCSPVSLDSSRQPQLVHATMEDALWSPYLSNSALPPQKGHGSNLS
jgi:hypothetical protein